MIEQFFIALLLATYLYPADPSEVELDTIEDCEVCCRQSASSSSQSRGPVLDFSVFLRTETTMQRIWAIGYLLFQNNYVRIGIVLGTATGYWGYSWIREETNPDSCGWGLPWLGDWSLLE